MHHIIIIKSGRTNSGWEELYGHDCFTKEEMQAYCDALDNNVLKVVTDDFDNGGFIPSPDDE